MSEPVHHFTVRDMVLPTTAKTAHLPNWMTSAFYGNSEAPSCSFAGDGWKAQDGGDGKPLCSWCLGSLRRHVAWLAALLVNSETALAAAEGRESG